MELLEQMLHRRSVRTFNDIPVTQEQLQNIITAALSSPTGHGYYPCELVVVTDKDILKQLEGTRAGAGKMIAACSAAIFVLGDKVKSETWIEDCSIMLSNMHLMADAQGLGSCWIQARVRQAADGQPADAFVRQILGYPEQFELEGCLVVANTDDHPAPHDQAFIDKMMEKVHRERF
ncbi:MAG: nitroreductase family protein [Firmicutes bacterium]|nr:nitroreductase family protein [Bacillota bacterium]